MHGVHRVHVHAPMIQTNSATYTQATEQAVDRCEGSINSSYTSSDHHSFEVQDAAPAMQQTSMSERGRLEDAREKLNKLLVSSIMDYRSNTVPAAAACISVLTTLVANVLQEPANDKMRQVVFFTSPNRWQCRSARSGLALPVWAECQMLHDA